ncbi:MAG: hypothetical protein H9W81_10115 [Enterococcus sp.]|nr:hypothetical protein [Enterococcus sp.]
MNKALGWKKKIAFGGAMVIVLTGLTTAGSAVAAPSAQAVTKSNCYVKYSDYFYVNGTRTRLILGTYCYYDYNWWEETFLLNKRDGWYLK